MTVIKVADAASVAAPDAVADAVDGDAADVDAVVTTSDIMEVLLLTYSDLLWLLLCSTKSLDSLYESLRVELKELHKM